MSFTPATAAAAAVVIALTLVTNGTSLAAEADDVLKGLRPQHPRIWITADDLPPLRDAVKRQGLAEEYLQRLRASGERTLDDPPAERVLTGPRLLSVSRLVLGRVRNWAGLYLITGERRFADRAIGEMRAAAAFSDWNPSHFLDTAEMTAALGVGYDWLYDAMSDDDRAVIRAAIIEKGLKPGSDAYHAKASWTTRTNNWAQVCSGGLTIGALAIADEEPELARQIITFARDALVKPMTKFAPDGGFEEGPGYWNYATQYTIYYLAALQSALGTEFGYGDAQGLADTGLFRIHTIGPSGLTFNYADARAQAGQAPQMFWMSRRYDRPEYAAHERTTVGDKPDILHLIWLDHRASDAKLRALPTNAFFRGVNVVTMRSSWDEDALFVGIKGGDNKASHAHLDLGSFVFDVGRTRWVSDPGPDDYNLPGYFGKQRWTYYHLATEGQNTLLIDGKNQPPDAKAAVTLFHSLPDHGARAVVDLSAAYPDPAKRVRRGVNLSKRRLLIQDELDLARPAQVTWQIHTRSEITIDESGRSATLAQDGRKLYVRLAMPAQGTFQNVAVTPPPPQRQLQDTRKLLVRLPLEAGEARIAVLLTPDEALAAEALAAEATRPLDEWTKPAETAP